jgi:uncharacterized protein YodC (DUF2158 family)
MSTDKQFKKFQKLDEEWRNAAMSMKPEEINRLIRDAAVNIVNLRLAKELDEDIARLKEELATANEGYKAGDKENSLRIEFLVECLRSQGVVVGDFDKKSVLAAALKSKAEPKDTTEQTLDELEAEARESTKKVTKLVNQLIESAGAGTTMTTRFSGDEEVILKLAEGAVVQEKGGGPVMNVTKVVGKRAYCTWNDDDGETQEDDFAFSMLKIVGS